MYVDDTAILDFCRTEKTLKEIVSKFEYTDIYKFKNRYLKPLLDTQKLRMTILDKPKSRNQKYITNAK